jgi:hypothetical protein
MVSRESKGETGKLEKGRGLETLKKLGIMEEDGLVWLTP